MTVIRKRIEPDIDLVIRAQIVRARPERRKGNPLLADPMVAQALEQKRTGRAVRGHQ